LILRSDNFMKNAILADAIAGAIADPALVISARAPNFMIIYES
jgi:hypothetical protein